MDTSNAYGDSRQDEVHLRDLWNLLIRNWIVIFLAIVAVVGGTAAYSMTTVPIWESRTSVRIDEDRSNIPVLDILQSISTGSQVETEMEVLRSRSLAESVVEQLALQVRPLVPRGVARGALMSGVFAQRWAPQASYVLTRSADGSTFRVSDQTNGTDGGTFRIGEPVTLSGVSFVLNPGSANWSEIRLDVLSFETAVAELQEALTVARPNRDASLVTVRYESTDTLLVSQVPNLLASQFISNRQEVKKTEARSTVLFLQEQIDTLSAQLTKAEEDLRAFQEGEQVVSLQAQSDAQATELINVQARRNQVDADRRALQELLDEIAQEEVELGPLEPSPYRRLIGFPQLLQNQAASEMLRSLNETERTRSELLQRRLPEDEEVQILTNRVRDQEAQLQAIATTYLQSLDNTVRSLNQTLEEMGTELERIPAQQVQQARLVRQLDILDEVYTVLQTRLKEAEVAQAVEDPSVRVIDAAILPEEPFKPRLILNLVLAFFLGSVLGVGIAFVRDYLDNTVHTREDIVAATGGAPVLGMIPRIRGAGQTSRGRGSRRKGAAGTDELGHLESRLVTGRDPRNPVSEAYRTLRTNITFSNPENPPRTIVFTSPVPQDGKSTTAANLCITLAQQGIKVLLIDADLRRGVLNTVVGTPREPGLTNVLLGQISAPDAIKRVHLGESGDLDFLSTGTLPPNPAELLGSSRMGQLLEALEQSYDLVIIDSAPLTVVTDAAVLGTNADGVILVSRANQTEKGAISYAVEQLNNVRAPVLGSVLNDVDFRRDGRYSSSYGRYGYYYQYYYGEQKEG
jgi:tyrosine-protein kinase Etk/Wzc